MNTSDAVLQLILFVYAPVELAQQSNLTAKLKIFKGACWQAASLTGSLSNQYVDLNQTMSQSPTIEHISESEKKLNHDQDLNLSLSLILNHNLNLKQHLSIKLGPRRNVNRNLDLNP